MGLSLATGLCWVLQKRGRGAQGGVRGECVAEILCGFTQHLLCGTKMNVSEGSAEAASVVLKVVLQ